MEKENKVPVKLARDPDRFIIIPDDDVDRLVDYKTSKKRNRVNLTKEPLGIPQPEKTPEIKPLSDPISPIKYPEENPIEPPTTSPNEYPPYIVPNPAEYPI